MLRPTQAELDQARELGIDPAGMNGPKLREEIKKAQSRGKSAFEDSDTLRKLADTARMMNVSIEPTDGVNKVMHRVEAVILELFAQKGIEPGVKIRMPRRGNKPGSIKNLDFTWYAFHPRLNLYFDGESHPRSTSACIIALYGEVVE